MVYSAASRPGFDSRRLTRTTREVEALAIVVDRLPGAGAEARAKREGADLEHFVNFPGLSCLRAIVGHRETAPSED